MTTLPELNILYPYDPTAKAPTHYVTDEVHQIPKTINKMIVPRMGAFYRESLIVHHGQIRLLEGIDYEVAALYQDATVESGKDVNVVIVLTCTRYTVDEVRLTYQFVGGKFTGIWDTIQEYINVLLVDPRKVRWDDILHKPDFFAPKDHFHDVNDVYGLNNLLPKLEEIRQAILRIRSKEMRRVNDRVIAMKAEVLEMVNDFKRDVNNRLDKPDQDEAVNLLKVKVNDLKTRIEAIESDTSVQEALTALRNVDRDINNRVSTLFDNKVGKEEYNRDKGVLDNSIATINAKLNELKVTDQRLDAGKVNKTDLTTIVDELNRKIDAKPDDTGLTCEKIGQLPEAVWEKGVTILGKKPNGECVRITTPENLFQDVGVSVSANKTSGTIGVSYTVKITVTNTGVATNEMTELLYTLPEPNDKLDYSISNLSITLTDGSRYEVVTANKLYKIYGLRRGGTFILEFTVTPTVDCSIQIGAQVNTHSSYDTSMTNNTSTLTLTTSKPLPTVTEDINYIPTVDCPRVIVTDLDTGKELKMLQSTRTPEGVAVIETDGYFSRINMYESLANKRFKIEGGAQIYVISSIYYPTAYLPYGADRIELYPYETLFNVNRTLDYNYRYRLDNSLPLNLNRLYDRVTYDKDNSIITFPNNPGKYSNRIDYTFLVYVKPYGRNCSWQVFGLGVKIPLITNNELKISIEGLHEKYINRVDNIVIPSGSILNHPVKDANDNIIYYLLDTNDGNFNVSYGIIKDTIITKPASKHNYGVSSNLENYNIAGNKFDRVVINIPKAELTHDISFKIIADRNHYSPNNYNIKLMGDISCTGGYVRSNGGRSIYEYDVTILSRATSASNNSFFGIEINIID